MILTSLKVLVYFVLKFNMDIGIFLQQDRIDSYIKVYVDASFEVHEGLSKHRKLSFLERSC